MTPLDVALTHLAVVFPGSSIEVVRGRRRPRSDELAFRPVPTTTRPLALGAVDGRRGSAAVAAGTVRRHTAKDSLLVSAARLTLSAGVAVPGVLDVVCATSVVVRPGPGPSVLDHLGSDPRRFSLLLGAVRANAKAVLALHERSGRVSAFAKLGTSALSDRLVRHEGATLEHLRTTGAGSVLDVPRVRHRGTWDGHELLVMSALPSPPSTRRPLPLDAVRAVVDAGRSPAGSGDLARWFTTLHERAARVAVADPATGAALASCVSRVQARDRLPTGGWHGDWGAWNMAWYRGRPQVWDWERFDRGVPVGLDLVHFHTAEPLSGGSPARARAALARQVLPGLAGLGLDRAAAEHVVDAYLLEIASRYLADAAGDPDLAPVVRSAHRYLSELAGRNAWTDVEEHTRAA